MLVFFCHSSIVEREFLGYQCPLSAFLNTPAWGGVWIFFIISGLLASNGFDIGRYQIDRGGIKIYYIRRVSKVLVPTWIFLILVNIFNIRESNIQLIALLKMLTWTSNGSELGVRGTGATWFVFVLMWLYLLTPLFEKWLRSYEKRHEGDKSGAFIKLFFIVLAGGLTYRIVGFFLKLDLYNWLYANVLACLDLYLAGMIGSKIIRVFPKDHVNKRTFLLSLSWLAFLAMNAFFAWGPLLGIHFPIYHFYCYISPSLYAVFVILLALLHSLEGNITTKDSRMGKFCNIIAPYTFSFYLWHSNLLANVADTFVWIEDANMHYLAMLVVGFFVVSIVSFFMTKMNNAIINEIGNWRDSS